MEDRKQQLTAQDMRELLAKVPNNEPMFVQHSFLGFKWRRPICEVVWTMTKAALTATEILRINPVFEERLRDELQRCYDLVCPNDGSEPHRVTFDKLKLSGAVSDSVHACVSELRAENERLRQESAFLREWGGRCQDEMEKQAARANELRTALRCLYDETADYIRINHLGDVHNNQSMKMASATLCRYAATPENSTPTQGHQ